MDSFGGSVGLVSEENIGNINEVWKGRSSKMSMKLVTMVGAAAAIPLVPLVGQVAVDPRSIWREMAVGTAQGILAIVVVAEALAIFKMFLMWRKDVERRREEDKKESEEVRKVLIEVVSKNTEAMALQAQATQEFKEAVYSNKTSLDHVAGVLEGCERRSGNDRRKG